MKEKKLIWKIIAAVLLIPVFCLPFINVLEYFTKTGKQVAKETFSLFGNYSQVTQAAKLLGKNLQTGWFVANAVFMTIVMVLAVAFIVLLVLDLCKVDFKGKELVRTILAYAILGASILGFLCAGIGTIVNKFSVTILNVTTNFGIASEFGMLLEVCFIGAGIFAILGAEKLGKKKSK